MDDPWQMLESAALKVLNPLWDQFAKEGKESAVFAPMAQYPNASAWLARSMAMSSDDITRKLGAMLAGWIRDSRHVGLLSELLERERQVFRDDRMSANSVGEDIMFAATRWTESQNLQVRQARIDALAHMIKDSLEGTPWNTVHWAVANLHHVTEGGHEIFQELVNATDSQMEGQEFLRKAVIALKQNDKQTLGRLVTAPSGIYSVSANEPNYSLIISLWKAVASAEGALE